VGQIEKPGTATPPKGQVSKGQVTPINRAVRETAKDIVQNAVFEKRPYLKMAFQNPYNLSLVLGGIAASLLTANPIPAILAIGAEGLWLLHAPENKTLRRLLWDPRFEKIRLAVEQQERAERMKNLSPEERERVESLAQRQIAINRLASQNPSFTGDLLRTELVKTSRLVDAFLEMALTCARYESYLENIDLNTLDRDRERFRSRSASDKVPEQERDIAKKNLAVIDKRLEKLRDIRSYLGVARGQLDLIENSFQLISDQIVTMQSPTELSGQLDDLLDGVESIKQTAADTEKMLNMLEV
jgi:hypothetical protein